MVATVAVFDSGLGSLSVVRAISSTSRCDIIYYADAASHPYGTKSAAELRHIISRTRCLLEDLGPDLVVIGSNTPTLLLDDLEDERTIGVWPPLLQASYMSDTVTVLATRAVVESGAALRHAESLNLKLHIKVVDASPLVAMVEYGTFLDNPQECRRTIQDVLADVRGVCTLSSTHLPFLQDVMESVRPDLTFLDPAPQVAARVARLVGREGGGTLQIYNSGGDRIPRLLRRLGVNAPAAGMPPGHNAASQMPCDSRG